MNHVETEDDERFLSARDDHFTGVNWKEESWACSVRNDRAGGRTVMSVEKESSRVWAKEFETGCDGSGGVGGIEMGRVVPSRKRKPAMTPSEASVRLSSRAYSTLSLYAWRVRLGLRVSLFKIAHCAK